MIVKNRKILIWGIFGFTFFGFLLSFTAIEGYQHQNLEVIFFDVGQGDSILIRTPSHQNILIDGGPDTSVLNRLGRALPFFDRTIDLMVLTHAHSDHLVGEVEVLRRYKTKLVLTSGVPSQGEDYLAWVKVIKEKNIPVLNASANSIFKFGTVNLEVMYPFENISQQNFKDLNETSIVMKLGYQNSTFVFTGDAPEIVENELVAKYGNLLASNVLKVGHHGSRYSSSEGFLQAVNPELAVISVGQNTFGHPHLSTIQHLNKFNLEILRTDRLGNVVLVSDGHSIIKK